MKPQHNIFPSICILRNHTRRIVKVACKQLSFVYLLLLCRNLISLRVTMTKVDGQLCTEKWTTQRNWSSVTTKKHLPLKGLAELILTGARRRCPKI